MRIQIWMGGCLLSAALSLGCVTAPPRADGTPAPPPIPPPVALPAVVATPGNHSYSATQPLAPINGASQPAAPMRAAGDIRLVAHEEQGQQPEAIPAPPGLKPATVGMAPTTFPIDLPTALRLADADNLQVALAREQVQQAYAEYNTASYLWLPSLRGGMHWNRHEGPLLDSAGNVINVNRSSLYAGAGGLAIAAGSPMIPGVYANFSLADAIFQPLATQQRWGAREHAANAQRNNTLLDVSLAYLELMRAAQDVAIVEDLQGKVAEINRLTDVYARTGQGLQADADRMRVELGLREIDTRRSQEALVIASARLTQMLRLEPCVQLQPIEPSVVPLCMVSKECECCELVARALYNRPELVQNRYLVGEAVQRMRREKFAPLVPSVWLGASYGQFGGGQGSNLSNFNDRFDIDATAFWELRNLGFGEAAARQGAGSRLRQTQIQELATMDLVAREVAEAFAQVQLREQQIATARGIVQFANESYEHNLMRIQRGQGLPIEVLQSTQALLQARREYLRTIIDYNASQFALQRALGWPVEGSGYMDQAS